MKKKINIKKPDIRKGFGGIINKLKTTDLPDMINNKFNMFIMTGFLIMIVGLLLSALLGFNITSALISVAAGLAVILYGCYYKYSVVTNGFVIKRGMCIDHLGEFGVDLGLIMAGKKAGAVVIETDSEVISLPVTKNSIPPVGTIVDIYVAKNSDSFMFNGRKNYGTIYGYVISPERDILDQSTVEHDIPEKTDDIVLK